MESKILVTYGTKHGATAEIAEKIGQVIREAGLDVDVASAKDVKNPSRYSAFVIGSAVYIGQWRKEARSFVQKTESLLASCPVWLFSSGPADKGDPVQLLKGWRYPKSLEPVIERIEPRDIAVFHGLISPQKMGGLERWMINRVKSPEGDFRDWDSIAAWARGIADSLKEMN